jgi:hypothetical protein
MGATVEAVIANQNPETITGRGVICIFCGAATPVPASSPASCATCLEHTSGISLVRCKICGKEAPYPLRYVLQVRGMPS